MHIFVLGTEMTPLKAVDGSQVTFFAVLKTTRVEEFTGAVAIPDVNVFVSKLVGIG
jgi:hypothetical protein